MPEGIIRLVVGFVALLAGWAIGFFDSKMRADKKIKQAEEKSQMAIQQAKGEAERAVMTARAAVKPAPPPLPGKTLLRLWLDSAERPALDLDDQRVDTAPISEPNRKRLLTLLNLMRPWIEGKPVASAPAPQPSPPAPVARSAPDAMPASVASTPPPISRSVAAPAVPLAKAPEKPTAPLAIVGQIDEILQARLANSPLAGRGIRLQESPEGSVLVWVGVQKFDGVGDVTDPEVQAIIRAATAEWEKKYTPGM
jgi:hypothetical protein